MNCRNSVCLIHLIKFLTPVLSMWDSCLQHDHSGFVCLLFVCDFVNNAVSGSHYAVSNGKHG